MSFAPEAKENWPPDSEEKKSEDLEAKEVAAPDPEASESKGSTPPNSNPLKDEAFGDTRLDRIHDILRGMQPLSKDAEKERAEILGIVEGFRSKACRYDYEILQKVVKILEKAETRQDDNLEADGTRPSWIRRAVRRLPFRRRDPNSDQSTDSQLQALQKVKPLLEDLRDNPYEPSPHGGPATVAAKKLVQFGKVVVSSFSVVPGASALGQALEALDTHLTAMANEGDYVADAKASMAGIHGVLSPLETTTGAQSSTQALHNVNNVVKAMDKDVEEWVKLPKALKYTALHPGGVSRAVDFEMRMQIHNNNFKDALLVLVTETTGKTRAEAKEYHDDFVRKMEESFEETNKLVKETGREIRRELADAHSDVKEIRSDAKQLVDRTDDIHDDTKAIRRAIEANGSTRRRSSTRRRRENLPMVATRLVGRDAVLADLSARLEQPGTMISISGTAGVGKSKLAEAAARAFRNGKPETSFVWTLIAETEASLRESYLEVLSALGVTTDTEEYPTTADVAKRVAEVFSDNGVEWLLVFDNVPDDGPERFTDWFFPDTRGLGAGRIVFTTRSPLLEKDALGDETDVHRVALEALSVDDGAEVLLMDHEQRTAKELEAARELSQRLSGLPLALKTVRKVARQRYGARRPLERYLEEHRRGGNTAADEAETQISLVLQQPFAFVEDQDGVDSPVYLLLSVLPCFAPDQLPGSLLKRCAQDADEPIRRLELLGILQSKATGVVDASEEDFYSIHRLLHECARRRVQMNIPHAVESMADAMEGFDAGDSRTWEPLSCLVRHASHLYKMVKGMDPEKQESGWPRTVELLCSRVLSNVGNYYRVTYDLRRAAHWHTVTLELQRSVYGERASNADIASTLNNLGLVKTEMWDLQGAQEMYTEALDMMRSVYGENASHADIAMMLNNLGIVKADLRDLQGARELYTQALEMYLSVHGHDASNTDIANTLGNLAVVKRGLNDLQGARELYTRALDMKRSVYGEHASNTDIANTLNNLAIVKRGLRDLQGAQDLYTQALDMKRSVYGEHASNMDIANTLNNLAVVKADLRDLHGARELHTRALHMMRGVHGEHSPNLSIARTLNNLGLVKAELHDLQGAQKLYSQALDMYRSLYGEHASNTEIANILHNLATVKAALQDLRGAHELYTRALNMKRSVYGEHAPNSSIASTLNNLANVKRGLRDLQGARELYTEALDMKRSVYGENASTTDIATTLNNLGLVKADLRDLQGARELYTQALDMYRSVYGHNASNADIANTLSNLANAKKGLNDLQGAYELHSQALHMYRAVYGEHTSNISMARALNNLGLVKAELHDLQGAQELYRQALDMKRSVYGEHASNADIANSLNNLGIIRAELRDLQGARELYTQALDMYRSVYGHNASNADIANTLSNLERVERELERAEASHVENH